MRVKKLDKSMLCNIVRSRYPEILGVRHSLQSVKVKRVSRLKLTDDEIAQCEKDSLIKKTVIAPYLKKWKKQLNPIVKEMEDIFANGEKYSTRQDKDELKADIMYCYLAYGFLPSEYICFELENKSPEQRKTFASDTDTKVFGYSVNNIVAMQDIINKGRCYEKYTRYFERDAIVLRDMSDYDDYLSFVTQHPVFVKKKVLSMCGKGVELIDINSVNYSPKEYFEYLISNENCMLEEVVSQDEAMARFNPSSVNTIRCITLKTKRDVVVPWCFLRTGRNGSFVDNGGSGGLVIGVDSTTGIVSTDGFDEYNNRYEAHPDTGVRFVGSKIPEWGALIDKCKKAAMEIDSVNYLSWDLAYTDHGWIVIEINEVGQLIGPQMTFKTGIKRELMKYYEQMEKYV